MAANKFATMVHRNTNKMTLILVYAVLEWILIVLLLLNSLFSYLIVKFAEYFGLKRPCLWCSRLDHVFDKNNNSYRDLICEAHAKEISSLEYCLSHKRLVESRDLCENCSASASESEEWSKKFAFFPWMKQFGMINGVVDYGNGKEFIGDESEVEEEEEEEENSKCCCCGVGLSNKRLCHPCILIKPSSWGVLDYAQKKGLVEDDDVQTFEADNSDQSRSDFVADHGGEEEEQEDDEQRIEENRGIECEANEVVEKEVKIEEENCCVKVNGDQFRDLTKVEEEEDKEEDREQENREEIAALEIPVQHLEFYIGQEDCTLIPIEDRKREYDFETQHEEEEEEEEEETSLENRDVILDFDTDVKTRDEVVIETWVSLGETLELVSTEKVESESETMAFRSVLVSQGTQTVFEDDSRVVVNVPRGGFGGVDDDEEEEEEEEDDDMDTQNDEIDGEISIGTEIPDHEPIDEMGIEEHVETSYHACEEQEDPSTTSSIDLHMNDNHGINIEQELVEFKPLLIRTSLTREVNIENEEDRVPDTPSSIHSLHHLLLKRPDLAAAVAAEDSLDGSDNEGGDGAGVGAVERLKAALKALYTELEEERSAAAVAASQTMAMINRLQEEKAAVQMEAVQYRRMMEEQSEYDREAIELLNDLMVKREREYQELERRICDYEARECIAGNPASSDDDNSYGEEEEETANTPAEAVFYLEEERLSILDQLRALEEKLFILNDDDDGDEESFEGLNGLSNGHLNGHRAVKAKRLLPLFDAAQDGELPDVGDGKKRRKAVVEEEVERVYERLQALEADREFLRRCIGSLAKGDKGLRLLHEILRHLRHLRSVEHRAAAEGLVDGVLS